MKKKPKSNYKDITLEYRSRVIFHATATEFTFEDSLRMVAIHLPKIGVIVVGRSTLSPSRCWTYPVKTGLTEAVSKTFKQILDVAHKKLKADKA